MATTTAAPPFDDAVDPIPAWTIGGGPPEFRGGSIWV